MTGKMIRSLVVMALILTLAFSLSSCFMLMSGRDYVTSDDVQNMIDKGMNGNITVVTDKTGVRVVCSNNENKLKEWDWFKQNRDLPSNWK